MASFADNSLFMAYLPVHICRFVARTTLNLVAWVVKTFFFFLLSKPEEVGRVRLRGATSGSFRVTWKSGEKASWVNPKTFEVQMLDPEKDGSTWETVYKGDLESTIVRKLNPDTRYQVRVRAKNVAGVGLFSERVQTRTYRLPSLGMGSTGPMENGQLYAWEQTLKEVTVRFELPIGVTSKQLNVEYAVDEVVVRHAKTGAVLMGGKTRDKINVDGCVWSRDPDTKEILLELEKYFPMTQAPYFWSCVFQNHPQIDCRRNPDGQQNSAPTNYVEDLLVNDNDPVLA